jgi:Protein of unknown function (DUF3035)
LSYRLWLVLTLMTATSLGGCDGFYRAIGKEKVIPDEFAVVSRAPLAIPPDYSLRPPRIGAQRPQDEAPVDQARQTVFRAGDDAKANLPPAADNRSPGEAELLKQADAAGATPNIRQLVDTDATSTADMSDGFIDKLAFWHSGDPKLGPTDAVIDPVAEQQRLQDRKDGKTAAASLPASSPLVGQPVIERTGASEKSSGGWFGWLPSIF